MERGVLVAKALLAGAQRTEVLGGLGYHVVVQFKHDAACCFAIDGYIKKNARTGIGHGCRLLLRVEVRAQTLHRQVAQGNPLRQQNQ